MAMFVAALAYDANEVLTLLALANCLGCAFVWGYSTHLISEWPRLRQFRRSQYSAVWDSLSSTSEIAANAATGVSGELSLQSSGRQVADRIAGFISLKTSEDVLEVGCGVGRVGWAIAPRCRSWTGCDISENMLSHARKRLAGLSNVQFTHLNQAGLSKISDMAVDVVYCTNVLPHLDQMERWRYVSEAHRVLRPSGRLYIDTIALDSPAGWHMLSNNVEQRKNGVEVPYIPIPSTPDELIAYFRNAGLKAIRTEQRDSLLMIAGVKDCSGDIWPSVDNEPD
jgi:ubiquinone/menaquinone biosynthesis C-methylase UbiE